jgi:hypothetical protein
MSSPSTAKPPISVGQSWLTRDNHIAVINSTTSPDPTYPILACVYEAVKAAETNDYIRRDLSSTADFHRVSYTPEGYWIDGSEHPIDLITLVSDASEAAESVPPTSDAAKPHLRVGQVWRDRTGDTHTITDDDNTERHPLSCSNQCWYARDGRSIVHDTAPELELIELVSDVSPNASEAADPEPFAAITFADPDPAADNAAKPSIRVGQTWLTRNNSTALITSVNHYLRHYPIRAVVTGDSYTRPLNITCTINGSWFGKETSELDLVELISDTSDTTEPAPSTSGEVKPHVIAISHGPDVVSRVMSDGSAWYAPTHHGIPTGPWTRYAD